MARGSPHSKSSGAWDTPPHALLDVRMLEQGRVWAGPDGSVCRVRDLPAAEAQALSAYLRVHCDLLYAVVLRREVSARLLVLAAQPAGAAEESGPRQGPDAAPAAQAEPGAAADVWSRMSDPGRVRLWGSLGRGPHVWLERTPLMRALRRQMGTDAEREGASR